MAPSPNKFLSLARFVVLSAVTLLSLVTLALSAHIINFTNRLLAFYLDYAALGVAVSLLSLLTFPAMLFIGRAHAGTFPTFIVVEICWTGFLWIMWLAVAASTANLNPSGGMCGDQTSSDDTSGDDFSDILEPAGWVTFCGETNAVEAFGFFNWLILLAYFSVLLTYAIMASRAGNKRIWTSSVNEANFGSGPSQNYTHDTSYSSAISPQYPPTNMAVGPLTTQAVSHPPHTIAQA